MLSPRISFCKRNKLLIVGVFLPETAGVMENSQIAFYRMQDSVDDDFAALFGFYAMKQFANFLLFA